MRIIAGDLGGRTIKSINETGLRPTTDRVRESMFSMVAARCSFQNSEVLDLFAGTGLLGFESISRGAANCDFVEQNKNCLKNIQQNVALLKLENKCKLFGTDVMKFLDNNKKIYDIIFADPPYSSSIYATLAGTDFINNALIDNGIFVLEHANYLLTPKFNGLEALINRAFGETVVSIYKKKNK